MTRSSEPAREVSEKSSKRTPRSSSRTDNATPPSVPVAKPVVEAAQDDAPANCAKVSPSHSGLGASSNPVLVKLAEYESVCGGAFADHSMFFAGMPTDLSQVADQASYVASVLKQYANYGIKPMVVLEPQKGMDLHAYAAGAFDEPMQAYFAAIKNLGVTDSTIGQWVLFPEANIPEWGNTNPDDYAANVNRTAQMLKGNFPAAKVLLMLDSKTYPSNDQDYLQGKYASLAPYVQNISKGLVDSFGLQGFPWAAPANTSWESSEDAKVFLNHSMAEEAARILGINNVWFNTGSYNVYYANSPEKRVAATPERRQAIMRSVTSQITAMKSKGYSVSVNIFAEDKSAVTEARDWSYWPAGNPAASSHTDIFRRFIADMNNSSISVGIYDSTK